MNLKSAFTLVELAIVIVIIGLLVGGVLQGQELITQAKNRKLIAQYDGLKASIYTFKSKYNFLPGDMRTATRIWGEYTPNCTSVPMTSTLTCNGNGNGNIGDWDDSTFHYEFSLFWHHLLMAKLVKAEGDLNHATHRWGPRGPHEGSAFGLLFTSVNNAVQTRSGGFLGHYGHFFVYGKTSSSGAHPWLAVLTAENAMSIDTKVDDGKPGTGVYTSLAQDSQFTPNCATTADAATALYNVNANGEVCSFLIKLNL